jgi:uncharacterized membrane protein
LSPCRIFEIETLFTQNQNAMTATRKEKIKQTLDSRNFFVSLVSLILLAFTSNGLEVGVNSDQIVNIIGSNDMGAIVALLAVNFFNPVLRLLSKGFKFEWTFLKSPNFLTQVFTVLLALIALLGVVFPPDAANQVSEAFSTHEFAPIAMALVINVANPIWHFFFDKGNPKINANGENAKG